MKIVSIRLTAVFLLFSSYAAVAQNNFWKDVLESKINTAAKQRQIIPQQYRTLVLDTGRLTSFFKTTPKEFTEASKKNALVITLPMPDGSFARFHLAETSIMEPGLAAQFPNIKTYGGQGIDDPYATIKIDWSERGFHAMIISAVTGSVYIDPYAPNTLTHYISYFKKDIKPAKPFIENGVIINEDILKKNATAARPEGSQCIGGTLRSYRLAVACTGEYAIAIGGASVTVAQTLAAIVTTVNRVDGIYENELDIRLVLINNNNKILFTDSTKDPFTGNSNARVLINESQSVIDKIIGTNNYDVGHTVGTEAGGLAEVGVVCVNGAKASGVTGTSPPSGDPFDVDYVAHEIGHEFGGVHTFDATTGSCGGNQDPASNAEPGSGSTIMAYAGICDASNNLQPNTDPQFHALSFDNITDYINNSAGRNCAVNIATGNTSPVVNAGADYTIPKLTPFMLTGSATDVDKDPLTYSWEEINTGGPFGEWNTPEGDAPIFRSFPPVTTPLRYFPKMSDILNKTTTIGEILPTYSRTLKFRLTARDNHASGGGVCNDEMSVVVNGKAGPFKVTTPDTAAWNAGTFKMVTWDVNNTNIAPVNCANVAIELSADGGVTFPVTLLASTPNDGSAEITVPENITALARIRVKAVGNIFFDISDKNFKIQPFIFTAQKAANNIVNLQWSVANEIDSLHYEIERSSDSVNFGSIGKAGSGINSDSAQTYLFNDVAPFQGVNYYRLKQVDKEGNFIYSKVVSVMLDQTGVRFTIYPNPSKYTSTLHILADMKEVTVRLLDALGRQVFLKSFSAVTSGQVVQIPLVGLSRGIYFLTLISDQETSTHKIMVQ